MTGGREPLQVCLPVRRPPCAQLVEIIPAEDTGLVAVVEHQSDGVIADWIYRVYAHIFLADLEHVLSRAMTAHFGRWRIHTQIFARQIEVRTVIELDFQHARFLMKRNIGGPWFCHRGSDCQRLLNLCEFRVLSLSPFLHCHPWRDVSDPPCPGPDVLSGRSGARRFNRATNSPLTPTTVYTGLDHRP